MDLGRGKMVLALLDTDDLLHTITGLQQILRVAQILIVKKQDVRLRTLQVLDKGLLAQLHIQGHRHIARGRNAHQDRHIFIAVLADHGDMELLSHFPAPVHGPVGHRPRVHGEGPVTLLVDDPVLLIADEDLVLIIQGRVFQQISQCMDIFFRDHILFLSSAGVLARLLLRNTKY